MMIEFVFWTVFWWIVGHMVRYLVKTPRKFEEILDDMERQRLIVEYQTNIISLIHAVFLISISVHSILTNPLIGGRDWTEIELMMMRSSLCYFVYDTIYGIIYKYNEFWMNVHHFVLIFTYIGAMQS